MFDDLFEDDLDPANDETALEDELEDFLSQPPETKKSCPDAMLWWYERREKYPRLSRMALDYLSIPGTLYASFHSFK